MRAAVISVTFRAKGSTSYPRYKRPMAALAPRMAGIGEHLARIAGRVLRVVEP
jgi:hypothetical protein